MTEPIHWPFWVWIAFNAYILVMLALSMLAHRGQHEVSLRSAALWSAFWIAAGLAVNGFVWWWAGSHAALQFLTGYLLEESLSVDNLFVILTIFSYFAIPPARQHRVLFWGILGAIVFRGAFILAGTALVHRFGWVLYLFGVFLIVTGIRMAFHEDEQPDPDQNLFVRLFRKVLPVCTDMESDRFFVRLYGRLCATPLLVALVVVETTDVMFAVDSIPAVFSVTTDPFIVYASNICAILGLRSLYFLLQGVMGLFRYLRYGLAVILSFVGVKMLVPGLPAALSLIGVDALAGRHPHIPVSVSLGVIAGVLAVTVVASLVAARREVDRADAPTEEIGRPGAGDPPERPDRRA